MLDSRVTTNVSFYGRILANFRIEERIWLSPKTYADNLLRRHVSNTISRQSAFTPNPQTYIYLSCVNNVSVICLICRNGECRQQRDRDDDDRTDDVPARCNADSERARTAQNRILQNVRRHDGGTDRRDPRRLLQFNGVAGSLQEQVIISINFSRARIVAVAPLKFIYTRQYWIVII